MKLSFSLFQNREIYMKKHILALYLVATSIITQESLASSTCHRCHTEPAVVRLHDAPQNNTQLTEAMFAPIQAAINDSVRLMYYILTVVEKGDRSSFLKVCDFKLDPQVYNGSNQIFESHPHLIEFRKLVHSTLSSIITFFGKYRSNGDAFSFIANGPSVLKIDDVITLMDKYKAEMIALARTYNVPTFERFIIESCDKIHLANKRFDSITKEKARVLVNIGRALKG